MSLRMNSSDLSISQENKSEIHKNRKRSRGIMNIISVVSNYVGNVNRFYKESNNFLKISACVGYSLRSAMHIRVTERRISGPSVAQICHRDPSVA